MTQKQSVDRRQFLRNTIAAGAGAAIAFSHEEKHLLAQARVPANQTVTLESEKPVNTNNNASKEIKNTLFILFPP